MSSILRSDCRKSWPSNLDSSLSLSDTVLPRWTLERGMRRKGFFVTDAGSDSQSGKSLA